MPITFLSLPRELRQAILYDSYDLYKAGLFQSHREIRKTQAHHWANRLWEASDRLMDDVDYVLGKWYEEIDKGEDEWHAYMLATHKCGQQTLTWQKWLKKWRKETRRS